MKTLIVIDMQNDFITGPLGTPEARAIVPNVKAKIEEYRKRGEQVIFTRDTHFPGHLYSLEGRKLGVEHCVAASHGWEVCEELGALDDECINKYSFGYRNWNSMLFDEWPSEIELVGVCTDICVVSNALALRAHFTESEIFVDASCCAGTTPENHKAALQVMKSCMINVIGE